MLVVKVELWPFGDESRAQEIGRIGIANLSGSAVSNYVAMLVDDTGRRVAAEIVGHTRSDGFWPLIVQAASQGVSGPDIFSLPEDLRAAAEDIARRMNTRGQAPR